MKDRSLGVTALAFGSVMVALYSQLAAIVLLLTGSIFTVAGSMQAVFALFVGAIFLGLAVAAYLLGFGFWTRRHWSWAAGIVVFAVLVGASVLLALVSTNIVSAILPATASVVGIAFLQRPAIRAELLGEPAPAPEGHTVREAVEAPKPVN